MSAHNYDTRNDTIDFSLMSDEQHLEMFKDLPPNGKRRFIKAVEFSFTARQHGFTVVRNYQNAKSLISCRCITCGKPQRIIPNEIASAKCC
nr:hypothetical protein [Moritella viscosa]SHO03593.1 UPF0133 protein Fphi_0115 [Moritella viscosa]